MYYWMILRKLCLKNYNTRKLTYLVDRYDITLWVDATMSINTYPSRDENSLCLTNYTEILS